MEYTGGSTGLSLALVCAVKGYPLRIVSSDAFAAEKIRTMRAFGAEVELIPGPDGITPGLIPAMMRRAAEITAQTGAFATDQFNNADMVDGYRRLGEELPAQLSGPLQISAFCSYVGTAGCFLGVTRALAAAVPALHRVVVSRANRRCCPAGCLGFITSRAAASATARPSCTPPTMTRSWPFPKPRRSRPPARPPAPRASSPGPRPAPTSPPPPPSPALGPGHRVVTIQVDSGLKYLTSQLYS